MTERFARLSKLGSNFVRIIEEELGVRIDLNKLVKRGKLVLYDHRLKINRFSNKPAIDRVELEYRPPVVFVVIQLKIGSYRLKVPVLAFDIAPD